MRKSIGISKNLYISFSLLNHLSLLSTPQASRFKYLLCINKGHYYYFKYQSIKTTTRFSGSDVTGRHYRRLKFRPICKLLRAKLSINQYSNIAPQHCKVARIWYWFFDLEISR